MWDAPPIIDVTSSRADYRRPGFEQFEASLAFPGYVLVLLKALSCFLGIISNHRCICWCGEGIIGIFPCWPPSALYHNAGLFKVGEIAQCFSDADVAAVAQRKEKRRDVMIILFWRLAREEDEAGRMMQRYIRSIIYLRWQPEEVREQFMWTAESSWILVHAKFMPISGAIGQVQQVTCTIHIACPGKHPKALLNMLQGDIAMTVY
jgi:hypothetical protein